jgi:hypothetical protein
MREKSILPKDTQDEAGGTQAQATFYATGFFPTSIHLAPLLNVALFWFPFASPSPRVSALSLHVRHNIYI